MVDAPLKPLALAPKIETLSLGGFDYGRPLGELIDDGGFEGIHPDIKIPGRFRIFGNRCSQEVQLVCFDRILTFDEAIAGLDNLACRPAALPEQLALAVKFKEAYQQGWIPALDSIWHKSSEERLVPLLCVMELKGKPSQRTLTPYNCLRRFPSATRFAAVKL
ncbi:MAG: hypothetical protein Q8P76_04215 [bacterium]|nr:hypothetical protein [bacterium]